MTKKGISHKNWREQWIEGGCLFWYMPDCPQNWDVEKQLNKIDIIYKKEIHKNNICPVCGFEGLFEPAYDKEYGYPSDDICPCCDFQFGLDDNPQKVKGIKKWRENWIMNGCEWYFEKDRPKGWSPYDQLIRVINQQYEK